MPKKMFLILFCFIMVPGCTNYLTYRADFDKDKSNFYKSSLTVEDNIQKESIKTIREKVKNLLKLCYVLNSRFPTKKDKYEVLEINLQLGRLEKSIEILEDMRKKFYKGFQLILTREDFVKGPLQLQFALEIQDMAHFLDILNAFRARIHDLERFRKECFLITDLQEERLEGVDIELFKTEKELVQFINKDVFTYLKNVGSVITKDPNFTFEYLKVKHSKKKAAKAARMRLKTAGSKELLSDVSEYTYYFKDERFEFKEAYKNLNASINRFQKTIDQYSSDVAKRENNAMDVQLAARSKKITSIMKNMAKRINNIFSESMAEVNKLVGSDLKVVDNELWPKLKAETEEEAKKQNFAYYQANVVQLSNLMKQKLYLKDENSDSSLFKKQLSKLNKSFKEKTGVWSPGYLFLNKEWKDKISMSKLLSKLNDRLKSLEHEAKQAIRPLWKTCTQNLKNEGTAPSYKMDSDGYLMEKKM